VVIALLVWSGIVIASMLAASWLSLRWGHDPFGWAFLAAVLGPIALIALVGTHQSDLKLPAPFERITNAGRHAAGAPRTLLGIDGSEESARAARYVASTHPAGSEVTIVTVLPREARPPEGDRPAQQAHEREVAQITRAAQEALRSASVTPRVVVGFGSPGEEIVRCAGEEAADVIVIGRRGAGLTKALLGSVSDYVVKHAGRNVTVVE
jgi:nucleotide-binding universal stress UspA family protein